MDKYQVTDILGLIRRIEDKISILETESKLLVSLGKNILKIYPTLVLNTISIDSIVRGNYTNFERHPNLSSNITDILTSMKISSDLGYTRYQKFVKSSTEFEIFLNNQLAKYKALNSDYDKKDRKFQKIHRYSTRKKTVKNNEESSPSSYNERINNMYLYLRQIANIEYSIYQGVFVCLKEYNIDQAIECRQIIDIHSKINEFLMKYHLPKSITDEEFTKILENHSISYKGSCGDRPNTTKEQTKHAISLIPDSNFLEFGDNIDCIAWASYTSTTKGDINLSPGDLIKPIAEKINGWQYGFNESTDCVGWYPYSFVKEYLDIREYLIKFNSKNNNLS